MRAKERKKKPTMICKHCGKSTCSRPRQLCWSCFYNLEIRKKYPPAIGKRLRIGLGIGNYTGKIPSEPTQFKCGSEEKIALMSERIARGELPCHPDDNKVMVNRDLPCDGEPEKWHFLMVQARQDRDKANKRRRQQRWLKKVRDKAEQEKQRGECANG